MKLEKRLFFFWFYTGASLITFSKFGRARALQRMLPNGFDLFPYSPELTGHVLAFLCAIFVYVLLPKTFFGNPKPSQTRPLDHYFWGLILCAIIVAYLGSFIPSMKMTYPLYTSGKTMDLGIYYIVYIGKFMCLEYFFRSFLLNHSLKLLKEHGPYLISILYMFIHWRKPYLEALLSFPGGLLMCWVARRYGRVWPAMVLHISLAIWINVFCN
jgi:membrane protease YdiL (CAAX protease family)